MEFKEREFKARAKEYETKKPGKRTVIWEGGTGFGVRIETTGSIIFIQSYRFNGDFHIATLGKYHETKLPLSKARSLAETNVKAKVRDGIDPKRTKDPSTVTALVETYLEKYAKPKKKSWKLDERILNKELIPVLGKMKARDVKRSHIVDLLDEIKERPAPIQARSTLAVIRKMFNFALSRSILESSPCVAIQLDIIENPRDRFLSEQEIKIFWDRVDVANMSPVVKLVLKFQLATGQRKGEIVGALWDDIDLPGGWWTIPKEQTKNKKPHRVPLSPLALDLLEQARELSPASQWVFPSKKRVGESTDHHAVNQALLRSQKVFGFKNGKAFTPHDLRRTTATMMGKAGIATGQIARILNHTLPGVTEKHYNHYGYDAEKRAAMDIWARKLESIITGEPAGKIVAFRPARIAEGAAK